tara:strand:+ start:70 stop:561 length:492 start_codon:yes stop_codon:yes gene_type:complete
MDRNPYDLKKHDVDWKEKEKPPAGYLDTDAFLKLLNRKGVKIDRTDNLPRFGDNNKIKMIKCTRDGKYGSVPTFYYPPSDSKIEEIKLSLKNNNNSLAGREMLKKKKLEILRIFDNAKDNTESRSSIADKVSEKLGVNCNRKLVRKVLDDKRSSQLKKLKKTG